MNVLRQRLLIPLSKRYPNPVDYYRALAVIVPSLSGGIFAALPGLYNIATRSGLETAEDVRLALFTSLAGFLLLLVPAGLAFHGRLKWGAALFVLGGYTLGFLGVASYSIFSSSIAYLLLANIFASILFGRRGAIAGTAVSIAMVVILANLEFSHTLETVLAQDPLQITNTSNLLRLIFALVLTGIMIWLATDNLHASLAQSQRTARQMRTISEIAQSANAAVQSQNLLSNLVDTIRTELNLYHVQVFLIDDEGQDAVLVASTGEAGQQLLARGHSLPVGSRSVIGQVTRRGQLVYAVDTSSDPTHKANEFLPGTRAELALPLIDGETVIGALDVQSTEANAFSPEDIESLSVMANQIAVAIRNARLFEQLESSAIENRQLYEQTQTALRDMEHLNRQLTGQAWEDFLSSSNQQYGIDIQGTEVMEQTEWTPLLARAVQEGKPILEGTRLAVPLDVRGQVLGATEITLPANADPAEAQDLVEAIMSRLALAMDNSRLFEETQALAMQEYLVNQVGAHLQTTTEIDDMLRITLNELTTALGAQSAAIRLRPSHALAGAGDDLA